MLVMLSRGGSFDFLHGHLIASPREPQNGVSQAPHFLSHSHDGCSVEWQLVHRFFFG